jgi:hypothetical protein
MCSSVSTTVSVHAKTFSTYYYAILLAGLMFEIRLRTHQIYIYIHIHIYIYTYIYIYRPVLFRTQSAPSAPRRIPRMLRWSGFFLHHPRSCQSDLRVFFSRRSAGSLLMYMTFDWRHDTGFFPFGTQDVMVHLKKMTVVAFCRKKQYKPIPCGRHP